ncbi:hypothetical protein NKR19_g9739, partial [Coniochaeta hoffmannii]
PAPPEWLTAGLSELKKDYPHDSFEATMRYCALNEEGQPVPVPEAGHAVPQGVQFFYLPRIRCRDCIGKLYTPGPETTVTNFEVHLRNRLHREKVDARVGKSTGKVGGSAGGGGGGGGGGAQTPAGSS